MGKNWGIAIGIDKYDNLTPLSYARRDAEAFQQFCLNEADFDRVYFFAEGANPIPADRGELKAEPTFGNLDRFLDVRFEHPFLESGDNLWFFFAGHGRREGGRDYLMPMDGSPGRVSRTGLAIRDIANRLRRSGADNVLMFLDACRSDGDRDGGEGIGIEQQKGVVTFFSCSPSELAYEIDGLGAGSFTYALLEGLRLRGEKKNCATVDRLYQHLRYRVPELNKEGGKPRQNPYAIAEPATKLHLILLPQQATLQDVLELKNDALEAADEGNLDLSEQLWTRVLAASPADRQAIRAIQRLALRKAAQSSGASQPEPAVPDTTASRGEAATIPEPAPLEEPAVAPPDASQLKDEARAAERAENYALAEQLWIQVSIASPGDPDAIAGIKNCALRAASQAASAPPASAPTPSPQPKPEPKPPATPSPAKPVLRFSYVIAGVEPGGFLGLGKPKIQLERRQGEAEYRREELGNGINLDLMQIPAGEFEMGSPSGEEERRETEGPQHRVSVPAFWMGKYAVTQAQYEAVIGTNPATRCDAKFVAPNKPVVGVSWNEAVEFCDRLSKKTGREYRLPSEAEWEYACRARTTTPFHFGETITPEIANYDGNYTYGNGPKGKYRRETTEVGSFQVANAFGLYDMHGNVYEWCLDHWHGNYQGAPTDGSAWIEGGDSTLRMLRGGSWNYFPRSCRSAIRIRSRPAVRDYGIGFRVVCTSAWTLP